MTRLAIVALFTSLIGPAMAADEGTPAPAQAPSAAAKAPATGTAAAATAPAPGKVIADILAVSGMKKSFEKLPGHFISGIHQGIEKAQSGNDKRLPPELQQALENSAKESFTAQGFIGRVTRAMKQDYNEKNYLELLADLSTPLARNMAELEGTEPASAQAVADFQAQMESNPMSPERAALLHRLAVASGASDIMYSIMASIGKGTMRGMASANGNCVTETQLKNAENGMMEKINAGRANLDSMVASSLAYTYRDVSDADLDTYVAIYEKENSKHIHNVISAALMEEFSQASMRMGRGFMKAVKEKKAAMGDQACNNNAGATDATAQPADTESQAGSAVAPATAEQQAAPAVSKSSIPLEKRRGGDVTQCLEAGSKSDKDIAACAEKFRH